MPTYSVRITINVPGRGDFVVDQTGVSAPTMVDAVKQAQANFILRPLQVIETAP